jgi:hypothetical protein
MPTEDSILEAMNEKSIKSMKVLQQVARNATTYYKSKIDHTRPWTSYQP